MRIFLDESTELLIKHSRVYFALDAALSRLRQAIVSALIAYRADRPYSNI